MAIAAVTAAVLFVSCDKDDNNGSSMDKELIGTWEGSVYTMYIDDKPAGDPTVVTLSFTDSRFVWTADGKTVVSSPYVCGTASDGKYFKWTEGSTTGGDAVFYSISGSTMTITGANGTIIMSLPKTLTRK